MNQTPETTAVLKAMRDALQSGCSKLDFGVHVIALQRLCKSLEIERNTLRSALVELRRWVGDGDCSDDAGCVGYQTTAYRDVIAQADAAILANAEVRHPAEPG